MNLQLACSKVLRQIADVSLRRDCSPWKDDEAAQGAVWRDLDGFPADRVDDRHRQAVAARARKHGAQVMLLPELLSCKFVLFLHEVQAEAYIVGSACHVCGSDTLSHA